jgi:hypothetical protein
MDIHAIKKLNATTSIYIPIGAVETLAVCCVVSMMSSLGFVDSFVNILKIKRQTPLIIDISLFSDEPSKSWCIKTKHTLKAIEDECPTPHQTGCPNMLVFCAHYIIII